MTPIELKDIVGVTFALGDKVATDTMSYQSSSLRVGEVTEVDEQHARTRVKVTYPIGGTTKAGKPYMKSVWRSPAGVVKVA